MNTAIGLGKKIILGSLFSFLRIGCLVCVCVCVCVYTYIHMVHISAGEYYFLGGSEQFCGRLDPIAQKLCMGLDFSEMFRAFCSYLCV